MGYVQISGSLVALVFFEGDGLANQLHHGNHGNHGSAASWKPWNHGSWKLWNHGKAGYCRTKAKHATLLIPTDLSLVFWWRSFTVPSAKVAPFP